MRLLITGGAGQLGCALAGLARERGHDFDSWDLEELDVCNPEAVLAAVSQLRPDWVLHCAAHTQVDRCESEPELAELLNGRAPGFLAEACKKRGAGLLHYSTDFIFDGSRKTPYLEDTVPAPCSVYGSSKALGERTVLEQELDDFFIVRTQWVYGPGGKNFPAAILAKAKAEGALRVVDDQTGTPTMTLDLAAASLDLIAARQSGRAQSGIYHVTNKGAMTWFDFARLCVDAAGLPQTELTRISSAELSLPARRPAYSVLDTSKVEKALGRALPSVQDALARYLVAEGY